MLGQGLAAAAQSLEGARQWLGCSRRGGASRRAQRPGRGEGALAGHPPGQLVAAAGAGRVLLLSPYEQLLTFPFCLLFHPMRAFPQQVLQTPVFSQTFLLETLGQIPL